MARKTMQSYGNPTNGSQTDRLGTLCSCCVDLKILMVTNDGLRMVTSITAL